AKIPPPRGASPLLQRRTERLFVGHEVVRRQRQAHFVWIASRDDGGEPHSNGGRAREWLAQDVLLWQLGQLLDGLSHVARPGDHVDVTWSQERRDAGHRLLKQACLAGE